MNAKDRRRERRAQERQDSRVTTTALMRQDLKRSRAVSLTLTQRDSTGARSAWSRTYNLHPCSVPMTAAWSHTATK